MAKTLATLRLQVRTYLDEIAQADWLDVEVDREINAGYMEVYTGVVNTFESYYSVKATSSSVASQQEYTLPTDIYKINRVEINYDVDITGSVPRRAKPVKIEEVQRDLSNSSLGISSNPAYYLRGNLLGFIPIPTKSGTDAITILYVKQVSQLSESTDAIDIPFPDRYFGLISLKAASVLLSKGQQEEAVASKYMLTFEAGIEKMKRELEDRISDDTMSVTDTEGADVDFSI